MSCKFIDIAVNLTDDMYQGLYHGKKHHEEDIAIVLERAFASGVEKLIVTGTTIEDSMKAIEFCKLYREKEKYQLSDLAENRITRKYPKLYCTVGIHPTHSSCFQLSALGEEKNSTKDQQSAEQTNACIIQELRNIITEGIREQCVVAVGEIGLDYDRLEFCPKDKQLLSFREQLQLASEFDLPVFFHNRSSTDDFVSVLDSFLTSAGYYDASRTMDSITGSSSSSAGAGAGAFSDCRRGGYRHKNRSVGVVHSFTGSDEELAMVLRVGQQQQQQQQQHQPCGDSSHGLEHQGEQQRPALYVGVNGCSLRTPEGLEALRGIPLNRLLLETDAPWCGIKNTHASKELLPSVVDVASFASRTRLAVPISDDAVCDLDFATAAGAYTRQYNCLSGYPVKKYDKLNKPTAITSFTDTKTKSKGQNNGGKGQGGETKTNLTTDSCASWCFVKDRSEPCHILHVNHVVAALHNVCPWDLAAVVLNNTNRLFFSEAEYV